MSFGFALNYASLRAGGFAPFFFFVHGGVHDGGVAAGSLPGSAE